MPAFRNFGRNHSAISISAMTATTSHAITLIPSLNAEPFRPTICSVDKFVSSRDPAMNGNVRLRPARKKPSWLELSRRRTISHVPTATKPVNSTNDSKVTQNISRYSPFLSSLTHTLPMPQTAPA